jgi:sigma-E factor negative regulatory protein RseA
MNEELDSQLSAMFDNELPAAQCELLARRLSRDEELKARWSRYAAIGATIRAEGGPRLNIELARRVRVAISAEPSVATAPDAAASSLADSGLVAKPTRARSGSFATRWWAPVGAVAVAASVAAAAILWVRYEPVPQDGPALVRAAEMSGPHVGQSADNIVVANPDNSYVVPKSSPRRSIVPATQLANYVVAHSEFSSPVNRRNLLSTLMSEPGTAGAQPGSEEPTEDANDDAQGPQ